MKKLLLLTAVCLSLSGCFDRGRPEYTTWSVINRTGGILMLSIMGYNLYIAPGDEKMIANDYAYSFVRADRWADTFSDIKSRGEIGLYIDGKQLANWEPSSYDRPNPAGFHFFNYSCWTYVFEEPDSHHWTLEIHPEDIGLTAQGEQEQS